MNSHEGFLRDVCQHMELPSRRLVAPWAHQLQIFPGASGEFWVRWTGDDDIYRWLHPTERRWVEEPNQIDMPLFANYELAKEAADIAPEPPTWQESVLDEED